MQHYQIQNLDTVSIHNTFTKMCINNIIAVSYNLSFEQTDIFNYQEGPICHLQLWIGKLLISIEIQNIRLIYFQFFAKATLFCRIFDYSFWKMRQKLHNNNACLFFPYMNTNSWSVFVSTLFKKIKKIVDTTI